MIFIFRLGGGVPFWLQAAFFLLYLVSYSNSPLLSTLAHVAFAGTAVMGMLAILFSLSPRRRRAPFIRAASICWSHVQPFLPRALRNQIVRPGGWADSIRQALEQLTRIVHGRVRAAQASAQPGQATRTASQKEAYRRLHVEKFVPMEDMAQLHASEIRRRIGARSMSHDPRMKGAVEKKDLLSILDQVGGSSAKTCTICVEDYKKGEEIRVLPRCRHAFHKGCIDQWFMVCPHTPDCPLCKERILH